MCPYYKQEPKWCAFFDTYQDDSKRDRDCLSDTNWKYCVNYTNRSFEEKIKYKQRINPDL